MDLQKCSGYKKIISTEMFSFYQSSIVSLNIREINTLTTNLPSVGGFKTVCKIHAINYGKLWHYVWICLCENYFYTTCFNVVYPTLYIWIWSSKVKMFSRILGVDNFPKVFKCDESTIVQTVLNFAKWLIMFDDWRQQTIAVYILFSDIWL